MAGMDADPSMSQSPMGEPDGDIERALSSPVVNGIQTRDSRHFAFDDYLHTNVLDNVDADNVALISTQALGERWSGRTTQLRVQKQPSSERSSSSSSCLEPGEARDFSGQKNGN